jgi:hypothetical protein
MLQDDFLPTPEGTGVSWVYSKGLHYLSLMYSGFCGGWGQKNSCRQVPNINLLHLYKMFKILQQR